MSELRECPLCRGKAQYERKGTARQSMIIVCEDCGLRCESGDVYGLTSVESYRWNTRPASRVETAARRYVLAMEAHHAVSEKPATRARERTAHQLWKEAQEEYANLRAALAQEGEGS